MNICLSWILRTLVITLLVVMTMSPMVLASYQRFPLEGYTENTGPLILNFLLKSPTSTDVVVEKETAKERLERFLQKTYNSGKILRRVSEVSSDPSEETEWIPKPQQILNRPSNLGREASYQKQSDDFIIPPELIEKILEKENLSQGTYVSRFSKTPKHNIYSKTFKDNGIWGLIGVGTSNFAYSPRGRRTNISAAIKKFDNLIIPKGETFSFNETLESVSQKDGFVYEKVIWNGEDKYHLGGGVCQVSTTVYRAAYNAGLPFVQRQNHSRKVAYYYPHGFDATIYLGRSGPDLKFTNDTPGDLMIQFYMEGNKLVVLLYGKKDREVDTTEHGGWSKAYWWKRKILKDGEETTETTKSYYWAVDPVIVKKVEEKTEVKVEKEVEEKEVNSTE